MKKRDMLHCVGVIVILALAADCVNAGSIPSTSELIDKYSHALDSTSSFTEEYEKTRKGSSNSPMGRSASYAFSRGQCRYDLDSQRMYTQQYSWGKLGHREYDEDKPNYSVTLSNEEIGYSNNEAIGIGPGKARRFPRSKGFKPHLPMGACYLSGFMGSGTERLDNVLRNAKNISVHGQTKKVGDSECFVLEADTKSGQYIIWLDPEHGYHPAQILHKASEGDYSFTHLLGEGDTAKAYLKNVRFEQIEGVWVPMEADSHSDLRNAQGHFSKDDYHYKRTKMILNPDHDKLGSFDDPLENPSNDPELKNGTRVLLQDVPVVYIWQDGKLIPDIDKLVIDELDKIADEIMAEDDFSDTKSGPKLSPSTLTVSDLLAKYLATQDKLQSFIAKAESAVEYSNTTRQSSRKEESTSEFRFDGNRVSHRSTFWDDVIATKDKPNYKSFLWDGKTFIKYSRRSTLSNGSVSVRENDALKKFLIATEYKGAPLMGICAGDYDRIDLVIGKADTVKLRDKAEKTGESQCYVIDAATKQAKYTVWFDPEHGYNIAKAEIQIQYKNGGISFLLKDVRFEKITGIWVPMEADIEETKTVNGKGNTTKWHHKRTEMVLNPDFETLKSFVPNDIQNGTTVSIVGDPGKYIWQDGKPVAEADSNVKP